ncbi:3-methyladenine DNA glycosylase [Myceligenerans indicum]|uniref:3-methyladenine DNA glycosylase n=1 Tax=Myceligenerans indicum TaxID=2593663 RepID=A0ABS1LQA4_9MICO|nr:3-methyladenine DNA glycosylase [Myceligenerans indicum]MBL0888487.1 3-methyladenine DNA glycosylase [Myceligenerans indicum]
MTSALDEQTVVPAATWRAASAAHARRADALTAVRREAQAAGRKHAIEDFLYTYYPTRASHLRRWHPGPGLVLAGDAAGPGTGTGTGTGAPHAAWRWYRRVSGGVTLDVESFLAERGETVRYVRTLLAGTASRPGSFGCFGLHEWAMVYRDREAGRDHRHPLPLRLGHAGTDAVVESHPVRCSHFDAYRFFTPEARDRNALRPTRATQPTLEQPGCLHANMDLYKWCQKLGPAVPGDLLLDAFELAREIRYTDMAASPYDVSPYGVEPVAIETPEGKAEYVRRQRDFADRSATLRRRLLAVSSTLLSAAPPEPPPPPPPRY